ncbi:class I SAM-dependent RNA methyltransferase [uncultured Alsobacter sp.]|uniref:class I SAM-dependent RNA methyltransferase n=1 Tax=uncultured Alsobacter sp. TaxID=1748258 RepID=UPI0025CD0C50|nr:RsmD family RNA methyltransferase [uncultured Alsobacter sp.]
MSVNTLAGRRLHIDRIGQRGDGIADTDAGPVFVPYALAGETVIAEVDGERGRLVAVETASPERVDAPCALFGTCGGCATQHWASEPYAAWKTGLVATALRQAGLDAPVRPLVMAHGDGRRRLTMHARRGEDGRVALGFMAARSHAIVPIPACPLLVPALERALPKARAIAELLAQTGKPLDVQLTATAGGLDVDVRGHGPAGPSLRARLVGLANDLDLARLSIHGDVVVERRPPLVRMGKADVAIPPGSFLQATAAGEDTLAHLVTAAVGKAKRVADLFCGSGPFALRLAQASTVHAVESDAAAVAALDRAVRFTQGLRPVTTEVRDLFRRPLVGPELATFDAVVFDPPRAGAEAQAKALAASPVPRVVAVSCNAGTFARDAAALVAGGYRLLEVTPVDQFLHSAHVELVGVFDKPRTKGPRRALG